RETEIAINAAIKDDVVCVEMEAAALYAYAAAKSRDIVCLAHITNTMALTEYEFEKGEGNGAHSALEIAEAIATALTRPTLA
ncbi:MAG: uridine phosphorylase, partial [Acidimicrobiaceae bacterium]|nr:uridine phosphorylase [Acidimicrobiaceae bacterium]